MPFAIPSDLDLDARLAGSFGIYEGDEQIHVKIRFSPRVARFVQEKHWHASQRCTPQRDGSLLVEFDLSSTVEVKCWALSFGRDAEVLEPPDLRDEMAAEVADLLALYHPADRQRQRTRPPRRLTRDK
jgi:proteasome accessory factor B